jgi:hypothetical protein
MTSLPALQLCKAVLAGSVRTSGQCWRTTTAELLCSVSTTSLTLKRHSGTFSAEPARPRRGREPPRGVKAAAGVQHGSP